MYNSLGLPLISCRLLFICLNLCLFAPHLVYLSTSSPFVYLSHFLPLCLLVLLFIYPSRLLVPPLLVSSCLLCLLVSSIMYSFLLLYTCSVSSSIFPSSRLYLLFLLSSTCCSSSCLLDFPLV